MRIDKTLTTTILISILFFLLLYLLSLLDMQKISALTVFIALTPFLIWLIASGKIKEIKGPGGIGLSLKDQMEQKVRPHEELQTIQVEPERVMSKAAAPPLSDLSPNQLPSTLSFVIGLKNFYVKNAIDYYLNSLSGAAGLRYILFTDEQGKFKGLMKADDFSALVKRSDPVPAIEDGSILQKPEVITESISTSGNYKQALNIMSERNISLLPVVDDQERFKGIITQDEIVRQVLTNVLRQA